MVDSSDRERIQESHDELHKMVSFTYSEIFFLIYDSQLNEDELRDAIVLVFANKQDLPNALSVTELTEKLGLNQLRRKVQFFEKNLSKYNYSLILLSLS